MDRKHKDIVKFGDLKTGEYFKTINDPPIWSDSFTYRKNKGVSFGNNSYVFNGPPNYCGISMRFPDEMEMEFIDEKKVNVPTGTLPYLCFNYDNGEK